MDNNEDHGKQNAAAWAGSIAEYVAALNCDYARLEELRDEVPDLEQQAHGADCAQRAVSAAECTCGKADSINAMVEELAELEATATVNGDKLTNQDEARERVQEAPLSVQVRGGWRDPGTPEDSAPEEFEILLSTGGPALRIRGELSEHSEVARAWLEYQDWGTGWQQFFDIEQDTLITFCSVFYFGE